MGRLRFTAHRGVSSPTIPGTAATDSVTFTVPQDSVAITSPTPAQTTDARPTVAVNGESVDLIADASGNWSYTP